MSFTKAAAAEVAQRCVEQGRPELAEYPHFIGTLDSFLWRHIVRPHVNSPRGKRWRRLESWDDHPKARREGISLENFDFAPDYEHRVRIRTPQWRTVPYQLASNPDRQSVLLYWAERQMDELWNEGFIAGEQLRDIALSMLESSTRGSRIGSLLSSRFVEIIVDESQDLSSDDRRIFGLLSSRGVPVLTVGDPDQRIYGFREPATRIGAPPVNLPARSADLRLNHNWRSTQIICDLSRTLRPTGAPADIAVGDHRGEFNPILLLETSDSGMGEVLRQFEEEADRLAIRDPAQRMVLAYRHATLSSALATVKEAPPTTQLGALVWATAVLRDHSMERKLREMAEGIFSEAIRRHWLGDVDVPEREHLERHNLSSLELQLAVRLLLDALPALDQPSGDWSTAAFQALTDHPFGNLRQSAVTKAFRCAQNMKPKPALTLAGTSTRAQGQVRALRSNTIHGVKGEEFDAVLVLMPPPGKSVKGKEPGYRPGALIETWISGTRAGISDDVAESLRVYYVAATRARRLLAFAVDQKYARKLETYLAANGVPVQLR